MARRNFVALTALAASMLLSFACGGRNLNAFLLSDDASDDGAGGEAGHGGHAAGGRDASGGAGGEGGRPGPGPGPGPSTGPGGIQDCIGCAATECPGLVECFTNPECQQGIACGVSECLGGGGGPDPVCFLECFNGDTGAAFEAFQALSCAFMNCQDECGGLLGGGFPGGP